MNSLNHLDQALQAAQRAWTGCDWNTDYGSGQFNLRGLTSRQAKLAADATRGEESKNWRSAYQYLNAMERDAQRAARLAAAAVEAWRLGDSLQATVLIGDAITIEARYREPIAYPQLLTLFSSVESAALV